MSTEVLEREVYSEAEAARLLGISPSTLNYWLEGGVRRGKQYPPVIREKPRGNGSGPRPAVTWAEFVEAGLLCAYRRQAQVPMRELRAFIDLLRTRFGVPYPLADRRPFASGKDLLFRAQEEAELHPDFWIVSNAGGQLALLPVGADFYRSVVWADDLPTGWLVAGPDSPVVADPDRRFGRPSIAGVSTEVIWEHRQAGEGDEEIADAFDLELSDVAWALSYELAARAGRPARAA